MSQPQRLAFPDLLQICPFKFASSPYYEKAGAESSDWVDSFHFFTDKKRAHFKRSYMELLGSYMYPYAGFEEFRTCCDLMNLLTVIDEITDDQDSAGARVTGDVFLRAMAGEACDGSGLSRMSTQFRERFLTKAGKNSQRRMLKRCTAYVDAFVKEASLRDDHEVLDEENYMRLRRHNSAVQIVFVLYEYVHGIDLPDEVFEDPVFMRLYYAALDLFILTNDLYSYKMEKEKELAGNNIMTVFIEKNGLGLQQAADLIGKKFKDLIDQFLQDKASIRSFGEAVDEDVRKFIYSWECTVIGNVMWSLDSQRFFGTNNEEVKRTRVVDIVEFQKETLKAVNISSH